MIGRKPLSLFVAAAIGAVAAGGTSGPARACATQAPRAVFEFAEGSAELDAADRTELADFARAALSRPVALISIRAFTDRSGTFEPATRTAPDLALAEARGKSVFEAFLTLGAVPFEPTVVGVAPTGAETRTGADGRPRHGRVVAAVVREPEPPRVDDGRPVPAC